MRTDIKFSLPTTCCKDCKNRYRYKVDRKWVDCHETCPRYLAERSNIDGYIQQRTQKDAEDTFIYGVLKHKDRSK